MLFLDDYQGIVTRSEVEKLTADLLILSRFPFTDLTLRFHRGTSK